MVSRSLSPRKGDIPVNLEGREGRGRKGGGRGRGGEGGEGRGRGRVPVNLWINQRAQHFSQQEQQINVCPPPSIRLMKHAC